MAQKISFDGVEYDVSNLSESGKQLLAAYQHVTSRLQETKNMQAILTRAKNSYLSELKAEVVKGKTGLDLEDLFSDD